MEKFGCTCALQSASGCVEYLHIGKCETALTADTKYQALYS